MSDLEKIELSIDEAKSKITKAEMLSRLIKTEDWKKVIEDGYFVEEASNVVLLKSTPGFSDDNNQKQLLKQIDAIGAFRQYLSSVFQVAEMARKSLEEFEDVKTEILSEE